MKFVDKHEGLYQYLLLDSTTALWELSQFLFVVWLDDSYKTTLQLQLAL